MPPSGVIPRVTGTRRLDTNLIEVDCPQCGRTHYLNPDLRTRDGVIYEKSCKSRLRLLKWCDGTLDDEDGCC